MFCPKCQKDKADWNFTRDLARNILMTPCLDCKKDYNKTKSERSRIKRIGRQGEDRRPVKKGIIIGKK